MLCSEIKRDSDRADFAAAEFRHAGRVIAPAALRTLVSAFTDDLAELAGACQQLLADTDGEITEQFRSLSRRQARQAEDEWHSDARAFAIIEVDDTNAIEERIDLVSLLKEGDWTS